jgi:uncharacterized membrane protein
MKKSKFIIWTRSIQALIGVLLAGHALRSSQAPYEIFNLKLIQVLSFLIATVGCIITMLGLHRFMNVTMASQVERYGPFTALY